MRLRHLGIAAGLVVVMAAAVATLGDAPSPLDPEPVPTQSVRSTPATTALRRCRDLREAALDDPSCRALWAESRRRFLGIDPTTPTLPGEGR